MKSKCLGADGVRSGRAGLLDLPAKERERLSAKICSYLQSENEINDPLKSGPAAPPLTQ